MNEPSWRSVTLGAYNEHAASYGLDASAEPWLAPAIESLRPFVPPDGLIGDLGCGPGKFVPALLEAGYRVVGLDFSSSLLAIGQKHAPTSAYVMGDLTALPLASECLDGVWASASFLHLAPDTVGEALAEARRVLKPGGAMYCSVQSGGQAGVVGPAPADPFPGFRYYAYWNPDAWRDEVQKAGFRIVEETFTETTEHVNLGSTGWISVTAVHA